MSLDCPHFYFDAISIIPELRQTYKKLERENLKAEFISALSASSIMSGNFNLNLSDTTIFNLIIGQNEVAYSDFRLRS